MEEKSIINMLNNKNFTFEIYMNQLEIMKRK